MKRRTMPPLTIGLTYDLKSWYMARGLALEDVFEFDHDIVIDTLARTLERLGHRVDRIGNVFELVRRLGPLDPFAPLAERPWDLVFNVCEGLRGRAREAQVPALLDAYGIEYTFADAATLDLVLDKTLTKILLRQHGIPTPDFVTIAAGTSVADRAATTAALLAPAGLVPTESFPVFVKPASEGTSIGISAASRVTTEAALFDTVDRLRADFPGKHMMVEKFLPGREFTVVILGTGPDARILGVGEYVYADALPVEERFQSSEVKTQGWKKVYDLVNVDPAADKEAAAAADLALRSYRVTGCRDLGRVDVKSAGHGADSDPNPQVIEVNALAGIHPALSHLTLIIRAEGMDYEDLVRGIVDSAEKRVMRVAEVNGV